MISRKHNSIFVHIPKTGGASVEQMIWSSEEKTVDNLWMGFIKPNYNKYQTGGLQHLLASQILTEVGEHLFLSSYKFSMVRNPFDKIVSQYAYMNKRKNLREFIGMKEGDSFERYLDLISKKKHVQWEHQYKFIFDENGEILVDSVMRFEKFNEEVSALLERLNISFDQIAHRNKGNRNKTESYFSKETYERVADMYAKDFRLFKYTVLPFNTYEEAAQNSV